MAKNPKRDVLGLLEAALELPAAHWTEFASRECGDDVALRAELLSLLQHHESASARGFLAGPVGVSEVVGSGQGDLPETDSKCAEMSDTLTISPALMLPGIDDYELLEKLGEGGMGVVYKARQKSLNRMVALKMIRSGQLASKRELQRFRAEAEAVAHLDHPGIIPVIEVGQQGDSLYYSMGYVEGQTLADRIKDAPLPPREAAELLRKIAQAIDYAHSRHLIHRDLKPANILLDKAGEPKVTDFGLAKRLDTDSGMTVTGQVMGTPSYMSPEQAAGLGEQIGAGADTYALGAILYAMTTGRPPFRAATTPETLKQVIGNEPPSPRQLNPAIERDLENICLKCLQKEPAKRYASAAALADDLGRFLRKEPVQARPVGRTERAWRWCRRNPVVASLTAAVAAALLIGTVVSTCFAIVASNRALAEAKAREKADVATLAEKKARTAETEARQKAEKEYVRANQERDRAKDESRRAFQNYYAAEIKGAQADWQANRIGNLLARLDSTRPSATGDHDFRGYEWHYLWRLCHLDRLTFDEHSRRVHDVMFSRDGKSALSVSSEKLILWNPQTGNPRFTRSPPSGAAFFSAALSPDATRLAIVVREQNQFPRQDQGRKAIEIWDAKEGNVVIRLHEHRWDPWRIAYSPAGQYFAATSFSNDVRIFEAATGNLLHRLPVEQIADGRLAFNQAGDCLAFASPNNVSPGRVIIWDVEKGRPKLEISKGTAERTCFAFSPDDKLLATGGRLGNVELWDINSGHQHWAFQADEDVVNAVTFGANGDWIACAGFDRMIKVLNVVTGRELVALRGHSAPIACLNSGRDASQLASGDVHGRVKIWDVSVRPEPLMIRAHAKPEKIFKVEYSADGTQLACLMGDILRDERFVRVWNGQTGEYLYTLDTPPSFVTDVAYSPDGNALAAAGSGHVYLCDGRSGSRIRTLAGAAEHGLQLAFSSDSKRLAAASQSAGTRGEVKVWNVQTGGEEMSFLAHKNAITGMEFSKNGRFLFTSSLSAEENVKRWDLATGTADLTFDDDPQGVAGLTVDQTGRWVATIDCSQRVRVRNAETGEPDMSFLANNSLPSQLQRIAFTADSQQLVIGNGWWGLSIWDLAAKPARPISASKLPLSPRGFAVHPKNDEIVTWNEMWKKDHVYTYDIESNEAKLVLEPGKSGPHSGELTAIEFTPDGKYLATAGGEEYQSGVVQFWDMESGKLEKSLHAHQSQVNGLAFSPDQRFLATTSRGNSIETTGVPKNGAIHIWDAKTHGLLRSIEGHSSWARDVSFNQDGSLLFTNGPRCVKVWDVEDGAELMSLGAQSGRGIVDFACRRDGRHVAIAIPADEIPSHSAHVEFWDTLSGEQLSFPRVADESLSSVRYSPDGGVVAVATPDKVSVWEMKTKEEILRLHGDARDAFRAIEFSPDGKRLVTGSNVAQIWDLATGQELLVLDRQDHKILTNILDLAFTSDSRSLAVAWDDGLVMVWHALPTR